MNATEMLAREFLEMRSRLIDLAAAFDRIDRAAGAKDIGCDSRWKKLRDAATLLVDGHPNRAERIQLHFSDAYDSGWRSSAGA